MNLFQFSLKTMHKPVNTRHDIDLFRFEKNFKLNALFSTLASCRFVCLRDVPLDVVFVQFIQQTTNKKLNKLREETFHL